MEVASSVTRHIPNPFRRVSGALGTYLGLSVFSAGTRLWLTSLKLKYLLLKRVERVLSKSVAQQCSALGVRERQERLIRRRNYDALIILDACRFDVFSETIHEFLDGKLRPVLSPASTTLTWLRRVWGNGTWKDTVYVSASPMINKRGLLSGFDAGSKFMDVVEVWDSGWDEELSTVPPNRVNVSVEATLVRNKLRGLRFPNDYRLIIHYVQPHAPYVTLQHLTKAILKHGDLMGRVTDVALRKAGTFTGEFSMDHLILGMLKEGLSSEEELRETLKHAYRENLRWVLKHVARLVTRLKGRVVITADHGELLGEYGLYFHLDLPLPPLRIVPWFTVR